MTSLAEQLYNQGIEQGMERGMERGMEQGMERGMEQGMEQGKLLARRADILYFLRLRFQIDSTQLSSRLARVTSAEILEKLLHSAYTADSYDEFLAILDTMI